MSLDTKSLIYYLCAWQSQNMSLAAAQNNVSVATVSNAIKRLENQLNTSLFIRSRRGIIVNQNAQSITRFTLNLLAGLHKIERSFASEGAPIDMDFLHKETADYLENPALLEQFLLNCRDLKISPQLIRRAIVVYEFHSIRAASQALSISQPQLSRQMHELETLLDTQLFERTSEGLKPLPSAKILYQSALELNDICERLIKRGDLLFRRNVTTSHLGTVAPFTRRSSLCKRVANICVHWSEHYPNENIKISADLTDRLLSSIKRNELHCAIVDSTTIPTGFDSLQISSVPLMLATGGAPSPALSFQETISKMPIVLPSMRSSLRNIIDEWLHKHSVSLKKAIEVESMTVLADLVSRCGYCSILPQESASPHEEFTFIEIPNAPHLASNLIWKSEMSENRHVKRIIQALTQAT